MGNSMCNSTTTTPQLSEQTLGFVYGEDNIQSKITHQGTINSKEKEVEPVLKECQQRLKNSGRLYKDPTMKTDPLILKSLASEASQLKCTFERPSVFLNENYRGKNKIYKIWDMAQCRPSYIVVRDQVLQYFGVFLCYLSQNPNLIKDLIITQQNSYGISVVKMNVGTKKEYVYIDDYILCSEKVPLFSQPIKGTYMWTCLLEKAWLKIKGNIIRKIEKNSPEQVFQSFLSYPIKTYTLNLDDQYYNRQIIETHLCNSNLPRGCMLTSRKQPIYKIGLSGRKHFYLLKVLEYEKQRLFYLRYPCLNFDFRGTYRVIPQDLQSLIKKQSGDYKIADGNFVLTEQQFLQQIEYFSIFYYNKSAPTVTEQQISFNNKEEFYIKMDLKTESLVSIALVQNGGRTSQKIYCPLTFQVVHLQTNTLISDIQNNQACFGLKNTYFFKEIYKRLKPGHYLIRMNKKHPHVRSNKKDNDDLRDKIVVAAMNTVKFDYKQQDLNKNNFEIFLKQYGKKQLQAKRANLPKIKEDVDYTAFWLGDLAVFYIEKINKSKKEVQVEVQFPQLNNLQCLSTPKVSEKFTCLNPIQQSELIVFEKIDLTEETEIGKFSIESF